MSAGGYFLVFTLYLHWNKNGTFQGGFKHPLINAVKRVGGLRGISEDYLEFCYFSA